MEDLYSTSHMILSIIQATLMVILTYVLNKINEYNRNVSINIFFHRTGLALQAILASILLKNIPQLNNSFIYNDIVTLLRICYVPAVAACFLKILQPTNFHSRNLFFILLPSFLIVICRLIWREEIFLTIAKAYTVIVTLIIMYNIYYSSLQREKALKKEFSDINKTNMHWIRNVVWGFIIWLVVWHISLNFETETFQIIYYLFLIVLWIYILIYTRTYLKLNNEIIEIDLEPESEKSSPLNINPKQAERIRDELKKCIEEKKPWKNTSLTLNQLALMTYTNRTYLSTYFNKILNISFYDYINKYRIGYACELLNKDNKYNLEEIAELAGFNSAVTLRRVFKKTIGCTPSQYLKDGAQEI